MSLRAAADALTARLLHAGSLTASAVTAGTHAAREVPWREVRLPALTSVPALSVPRVSPRTGLALAAVSGVTVATLATAAVVRRRHARLATAQQSPSDTLPESADYPGPDRRWDRIALGVRADGTPADIRLGYTPHILLVGTTGSGKSVTGRNILLHALTHADDWNIVGIDLFKVELSYLHGYDHATVATTLEETVIALANVSTEMDRRYTHMEQAGVNHFRDLPAPPKATLVYVDEALLLAQQPATSEAQEAANFLRGEVLRMLGTIARLGRAAGVHLVLAAQYVDTNLLAGDLVANFDARIVMGKHNAAASELALGTDAAAHLPTVRGRGLLSTRGHVEEFQSYFAPQDWYAQHVAADTAREQSLYHPITRLRTPSGVVICTDPAAVRIVTDAAARLAAHPELRAVTASTPAEVKHAIRRGADVIGYVGSLDDAKAIDRLVWAATVGSVVYVAAPGHSYDDIAALVHDKAEQRQVGCQIVADA